VIVDVINFGGDSIGGWDGTDSSVGVLCVNVLFAVLNRLALDEETHLFFKLQGISLGVDLMKLWTIMSQYKFYMSTYIDNKVSQKRVYQNGQKYIF